MNHVEDPLRPVASAYVAALADLATATTGRTRGEPEGTVLAVTGVPVPAMNAILSPSLRPNVDEIASLAAAEGPWELPWSIQVRGVPGPDVGAVAARHGLTRFEREPLMVRRPEQGLPPAPSIESLRVRAVAVDELELYGRTVAEGFEAPYELFRVLADPAVAKLDGTTCYLAEVDGVPVGTGMTIISGDITGIYNVTTLPGHRRRGYGRAVTTQLVRAGFAAGAPTVYLHASPMGEPVYSSAGFRTEEYRTMITAAS